MKTKRFIAFIIDIIVGFLFFYLSFFVLCFIHASVDLISSIPISLLYTFMCSKDCINGMSFGKYIVGIQTIDSRTLKVATPVQCMLRNLFCIIWPIEFFGMLFNSTGLRIGDQVAHTKVVKRNISY